MKEGKDARTGGRGGVKSEGGNKQKEGEGRKEKRKEGTKDFLKLCREPQSFSLWGDLKEKFNFFQRILSWIF